jgi:hypothetical protein
MTFGHIFLKDFWSIEEKLITQFVHVADYFFHYSFMNIQIVDKGFSFSVLSFHLTFIEWKPYYTEFDSVTLLVKWTFNASTLSLLLILSLSLNRNNFLPTLCVFLTTTKKGLKNKNEKSLMTFNVRGGNLRTSHIESRYLAGQWMTINR